MKASVGQSFVHLGDTTYTAEWARRALRAREAVGPLTPQDTDAVELLRLYELSTSIRFTRHPIDYLYYKAEFGRALRHYVAAYPAVG